MIARLTGRLARRTPQAAVLDVHGVGYLVTVPLSTFYALPDEGTEVTLEVSTQVREDAIQLFGFATAREKQVFELLITVSKVGPKLATNILSGMAVEELARAIAAADVARLSTIPGVGTRTAERLVVELRDKAAALGLPPAPEEPAPAAAPPADRAAEDAVAALANLGYRPKEAEKAVARAAREGGRELEDLIRRALALLSG